MATAAPGNYVFTVSGTNANTNPASTFTNATYTVANAVVPPAQATLTAAMFPAITSTVPTPLVVPASFASGAAITVNWTVPAGLTPSGVNIWGQIGVVQAFPNLSINNYTGTLPNVTTAVTIPAYVGVLTSAALQIQATDVNGVSYATQQQY